LKADERYGFVGSNRQPAWEAELIGPARKTVVSHMQGRRNTTLIRRLLTDEASRLVNPHDIALFADGLSACLRWFRRLLVPPTNSDVCYRSRQVIKVSTTFPGSGAGVGEFRFDRA
jgi:hypothetical protein